MLAVFYVVVLLLGVLCVAFTTLLERKLIGLSQYRISVNKVAMVGVFQPLVDGIKLLFKSLVFPVMSTSILWFISPGILFLVCYFIWVVCLLSYVLFFSCWFLSLVWIFGMTIFGTMLSSLSSSTGYSVLGASRSSCQTVCFELVFFILVTSFLLFVGSFSKVSFFCWILVVFFWIPTMMCELMRAPLDLPEGESELVSGYNIEYSSSGFVLLFLSEYSNLFTISVITSLFLVGASFMGCFLSFLFFVFIRSVYVRIKLDTLIKLLWFVVLPNSIFWMCFGVFIL